MHPDPLPLIAAAMAGDRRAQNDLWRTHRPWLAAVLLSHKPREIDIEDLMQDVAVKYVSKLHTLREPSAFRPWLRRIAINAAREMARSMNARHSRDAVDGLVEQDPFESPAQGPSGEDREEAAALLRHALTLPAEFREPLLLRCVQGLSSQQISDILALPRTTVETRISRARRMLREEWTGRRGATPNDTERAARKEHESHEAAPEIAAKTVMEEERTP